MLLGAQNPSLRDGLTPAQVVAFKRTAINTLIDAGTRLQMDNIAIATGVVFLHTFYATKSLVRNDPFLMSVACLYLGGKVEDSPKSVRDVLMASCELRYRDGARRLQHERELYEGLREKVFQAERALLYALDFQFNVEQPFKPCLAMLSSEPLKSHREALLARDPKKAHLLAQFAINFVTDSGRQIAVACIWLAMKLLKEESHIYTDRGQLWWVAEGVQEAHLEGVEELLQQLYSQNLYSIYSDKNLVPQSMGLLSPQQLKAMAEAEAAEHEKQRVAAAASNGAQPQQPPPQAHVEPAAVGLPAAAASAVAAAAAEPAAAPAEQQAVKKEGEGSDYDDELFAVLG
ncbi:hypothetical protein CHLNCDRAFT_138256 [Chlorella variabilis]|uniref:Cyclin-like domain-containing protein n=1 Tax=Chlorella variabilis TaxID=554065 RepID=E1ZMM6_CHLVA|nr:hypothetical protein CHLNCDRAFT_138256 [Chlorella variabilis]EFN52825.1 hypothetical protein CHLNCDRAFT_138256 [Chlorella variabilis]|eukprot:XP_005844927.1 hypothetical protein CHLNCDRAFT_138256 [Chlorella variabilis]